MSARFEVEGRPVPQGSMTASYNRETGTSHVHHVQGAALALWRAELRKAAREAGAHLLLSPVFVTVSFGMPRPKKHMVLRHGKYVVRQAYMNEVPATAPDLDKLVRALLDALTGVCYDDDRQVVRIDAEKVYRDRTIVEVASYGDTATQASLGLGA